MGAGGRTMDFCINVIFWGIFIAGRGWIGTIGPCWMDKCFCIYIIVWDIVFGGGRLDFLAYVIDWGVVVVIEASGGTIDFWI